MCSQPPFLFTKLERFGFVSEAADVEGNGRKTIPVVA
jgi:hypothetical protein